MPRPKVDIDEEQVEEMAAIGCTVAEIAGIVGCSPRTVERRAAAPVARGRARLNISLRGKQIEMAMSGNASMLIWLGKQLLGQREKADTTWREEIVTVEEIAPKPSDGGA
jgi:hypothetical protein